MQWRPTDGVRDREQPDKNPTVALLGVYTVDVESIWMRLVIIVPPIPMLYIYF